MKIKNGLWTCNDWPKMHTKKTTTSEWRSSVTAWADLWFCIFCNKWRVHGRRSTSSKWLHSPHHGAEVYRHCKLYPLAMTSIHQWFQHIKWRRYKKRVRHWSGCYRRHISGSPMTFWLVQRTGNTQRKIWTNFSSEFSLYIMSDFHRTDDCVMISVTSIIRTLMTFKTTWLCFTICPHRGLKCTVFTERIWATLWKGRVEIVFLPTSYSHVQIIRFSFWTVWISRTV